MNKQFNIANLKLSSSSNDEILSDIKKSIFSNNRLILLYAEFNQIVLLSNNPNYLKYFSVAHQINYNGFGMYLALKLLFGNSFLIHRLIGIAHNPKFFELCIKYNWKIFFLGNDDEHLNILKIKYHDVFAGGHHGYFNNDEEIIDLINKSKADILLVGMGTPKQEKWIYENHSKINSKVIISVGNAFKVLSGTYYRPNKIIQFLGLEWLTRLILEPRRLWKRYLLGIPKFFLIILKQKYFKK